MMPGMPVPSSQESQAQPVDMANLPPQANGATGGPTGNSNIDPSQYGQSNPMATSSGFPSAPSRFRGGNPTGNSFLRDNLAEVCPLQQLPLIRNPRCSLSWVTRIPRLFKLRLLAILPCKTVLPAASKWELWDKIWAAALRALPVNRPDTRSRC